MSTSSILVAAVCAIGLSVTPVLAETIIVRVQVTNNLDNPGEELAVTFHMKDGEQTRSVRLKPGNQEVGTFTFRRVSGDSKTYLVKVWALETDGSRNAVPRDDTWWVMYNAYKHGYRGEWLQHKDAD